MKCRSCGTEIAAKAIVCFRCGTATADEAVAPRRPAGRPARRWLPAVLGGGVTAAGVAGLLLALPSGRGPLESVAFGLILGLVVSLVLARVSGRR